ncbi:MAG: hypothetical protein J5821_01815 [Alphaproteobacteria bacterium]|nr:hypothetical protein [Alphaproteobacteria bacterium]
MKKLAFSVFAAALTFGANAADDVEVAATQACCGFNGIYFGLGAAAVDNGIKTETAGVKGISDHSTRLGATAVLGYGRAIKEKAFLGLEAGLDASQNFESGTVAKVNGLTPSVALRLGYAHAATKSMVYLKAGAAYSKAKWKFENAGTDYELKNSKWAPIVALGGEKICGKVRTRLEAEYRFRANKSMDVNSTTYKLTNRGAVTLRAMAIYTVKM